MKLTATLQLHTPLPQPRPLIQQRFTTPQTSFKVTASCERGMESCEIGLPTQSGMVRRYAWLPEPVMEYRDFGYVLVTTGLNDTLFAGRASGPPQFVGGEIRAIVAQGLWDTLADIYYSNTDATDTTSGAIMQDVIRQCAPGVGIDLSHWDDPGVTHAPSEFDGTLGSQVIDELLREGSGNGTTYDLRFWPGANGTVVAQLASRVAPDTPDYECDWVPDQRVVNVTYDPHAIYSHVRARYTPAGGSATVSDWQPGLDDDSFLDAHGYTRQLEINAGQKTQAGAEQLRDTQQAMLSQRQWGGTINVSQAYRLVYASGNTPVPTQQIRAGRWVRLRGLYREDGRTPIFLLIQRCVYDYGSDTAQLTVSQGVTRRTLTERVAETVDAVRRGRNPWSGAKAV